MNRPTTIGVCTLLILAACHHGAGNSHAGEAVSDIKPDETVVFFRTAGWLDESSQQWHLPVHGWIYEPEDSTLRIAAVKRILEEKFDLTVSRQAEENFTRRVNLLLADNERGKRIVIDIAGRRVELSESAENGHFEHTVVIAADEAQNFLQDGRIEFSAVTARHEKRQFTGAVQLLSPGGLSVISDIDDTVKLSYVTDRERLLEHTFLLDFAPAPGMAELYRNWSAADTGFHFVSSSPWQLYQPLSEFLDTQGFPWATFSLKSIRFRDATLLDLFKKGTETKPAAIVKILDRYPQRHFVLVGDSGEQDPEVYAALLRQRPGQVRAVYIRNVSDEAADNARFVQLFGDLDPANWALFPDPAALTLPEGL